MVKVIHVYLRVSTIRILHGKGFLDFNIKETKPSHYITLDTDIEVDFQETIKLC